MTTPATENQRVTAFVHRHQAGIWRWLRALGCDPARAEEHCQDALLAALHGGVDGWPEADVARCRDHAAERAAEVGSAPAPGERPGKYGGATQ